MFRGGIAATAHQAAEPLTFSGSGVRKVITRLQNKTRPLPLGEGWGEGLARTRTNPAFFFSFSLSCAPSPWPSPNGRGKTAYRHFVGALFMVLCLFAGASAAFAQTTSFTYQGRLTDGGTPANGNYDLQFALFDSLSGGAQVGSTQTINTVPVSNGVFTVSLDFGANAFTGASRFLEISARPTGGSFTLLTPRQQVTSTPYAIRSANASSADTATNATNATNATTATNATQLGGIAASQYVQTNDSRLSDARPPTPGSSNYIQNTTSSQSSNFNISGNGTAGGTLSGNVVNATTQYNLNGTRILSNPGTSNLFGGTGAGAANTSGFSNAFFGSNAGAANTTGSTNTFVGSSAGAANTTASENTFVGFQAGFSNTTTGGANSFFGAAAGQFNTTGSANSFFGRTAGVSNTNGCRNSFFGGDAGRLNTGGSMNSFFGVQAGSSNFTGQNNSYFGDSAGFRATGSSNTFIGASADFTNESPSGNRNTLIGANTVLGSGGQFSPDNATAIGANARVDQGNFLVLGSINGVNFATANTNVGIGTTTPTARLHVVGNTNLIGSVGINTTDMTRTLTVAGRARVSNIPQEPSGASVCFNVNGDLLQCGASSLKWKTNVRSFRSGLDIIQQLRPISFNWKEDGRPDIGLGAEEVAKVAPSLTFTDDKGVVTGVKYERLSMLLINAVQEQQAIIEGQQA